MRAWQPARKIIPANVANRAADIMRAMHFAAALRSRQVLIGYWVSSDSAAIAERLASVGYDYICLDVQHGLLDYPGVLRGLTAVAAGGAAGIVRVPPGDPAWIGRALDAGARGVIVPLVSTAEQAAAAVAACRYPPAGQRSFGPVRSALAIGPAPRAADDQVACIVMIETAEGLANAAAICAVPGVDAVYVGPSDLSISLGADDPVAGWARPEFARALADIRSAAQAAGIGCGMHCSDGEAGARFLADGFTFVSISSDLTHLQAAGRAHLARARGGPDAGPA
jgi:4-hydroxy-2-oxoheptanedioate aldolase